MRLRQEFFQVERKTSILIPIRVAKIEEVEQLIYGASHCPACDCELIAFDIMNKIPVLNSDDNLQGWVCKICNSEFDLKDRILIIGDFDIFSQVTGEA
jgi:transposase-like protein